MNLSKKNLEKKIRSYVLIDELKYILLSDRP